MVKTAKMGLLRALVGECLSAAAQEIFTIVERIITEHEEDASRSQWGVDGHHTRLEEDEPHREDQRRSASMNVSLCWEPTSSTEERLSSENTHTHSFTSSENDQKIPTDFQDIDVKQENDLSVPLKKLFRCHVCSAFFPSKKTLTRHVKTHPEENQSRRYNHESVRLIRSGTHKGDLTFDQTDSLLKHTEDTPHQCVSDAQTDPRSVTPTRWTEVDDKQLESDGGRKTFPLTITSNDRNTFDPEALRPPCLYRVQDASAVVPVRIKSEPAGCDGEIPDSATDNQLFLPVNLPEPGGRESEPKHLTVKTVPPKRPPGKPTKAFIRFEAGTAEKPFKCPCCAKCFSLTKTLMRHLRIHMEEKPYQCRYCGRSFCQKSDLVNHTRIHTGERPYRCHQCHKSFAQKGNLVVHMRTHTGQKLYEGLHCS
ncbi:zinc finger protein 182-like [Antennarius striatus]|uniref:zinc finger protein 182-like n=1 Tax=Antennarius striatus TaxID=241820 RepID=UPI0035B4BE3A